MSIRVKICGLRDAAGIEAAIEAGADAVGLVFHPPSPRNLALSEAVQLVTRIPETVLTVAVMMHPDGGRCEAVLGALSPDIVQTDSRDFDYLEIPQHIGRWPVVREPGFDEDEALPGTFVYEGARSGRGETVDWQRAAGLAARGRMILGGGLDAENVAEAIHTVRPWAVDVSSGVESAPGEKDPRKIKAFIAAARAAG